MCENSLNQRQSAPTGAKDSGSNKSVIARWVTRLVRFFDSVASDTTKTLQFAFCGLAISVIFISIGVIVQVVAVSRVNRRVDAMQAPKIEQLTPQPEHQ